MIIQKDTLFEIQIIKLALILKLEIELPSVEERVGDLYTRFCPDVRFLQYTFTPSKT